MPSSSPHRRSNSSAGASTVRPARNVIAASSSTGSTVALMRRSPPEASTSASQSRKSRHATALVAILCPLRSWRDNAESSTDSPPGGPPTNLNALLGRKLDHVRLAHNLVDGIVVTRDDLVRRSGRCQQPEPQLRLDAVEALLGESR